MIRLQPPTNINRCCFALNTGRNKNERVMMSQTGAGGHGDRGPLKRHLGSCCSSPKPERTGKLEAAGKAPLGATGFFFPWSRGRHAHRAGPGRKKKDPVDAKKSPSERICTADGRGEPSGGSSWSFSSSGNLLEDAQDFGEVQAGRPEGDTVGLAMWRSSWGLTADEQTVCCRETRSKLGDLAGRARTQSARMDPILTNGRRAAGGFITGHQ